MEDPEQWEYYGLGLNRMTQPLWEDSTLVELRDSSPGDTTELARSVRRWQCSGNDGGIKEGINVTKDI